MVSGIRTRFFPRKTQFLRKYKHLKIVRVLDRYISTVLVQCNNKQSLFEGVALWKLTLRFKNSWLAHIYYDVCLDQTNVKQKSSTVTIRGKKASLLHSSLFCLYLCILIALRMYYTTNQQTLHTVYIGYLFVQFANIGLFGSVNTQ